MLDLRLESDDLLRGTTLSVLLRNCGRTLARTSGGVGVSEDVDDEFAKSFPVSELDYFLSHSWHADWRTKYVSLLFYFNSKAAIVASISTSAICFLFRFWLRASVPKSVLKARIDHTRCHLPNPKDIGHIHFSESEDVLPCCLLVGSSSYCLALLFWHRCGWSRNTTIFLDKLCIHQHDIELKMRGIRSIGAILARSSSFLVAWDPTYFSRLWCLYELSVFKYAMPKGSVVFLSISVGYMLLGLILGEVVAELLIMVLDKVCYFTIHGLHVIYMFCWVFTSLFFTRYARRCVHDLFTLDSQLNKFSVKNASCFCCSVGHVHPDTRSILPCDRQLVYESIVAMDQARLDGCCREDAENHEDIDGSDCREVLAGKIASRMQRMQTKTSDVFYDERLQHFDAIVRTTFRMDITRSLNGPNVRYSLMLALGVFPGMCSMDWSLSFDEPLWFSVYRFTYWTFFAFPISIGVFMRLASWSQLAVWSSRFHTLIELLIGFVFSAALSALTFVDQTLSVRQDVFSVLWVILECIIVWLLYFRRRCRSLVDEDDWARDIVLTSSSESSES
eukprot:TRINITY_DN72045_c0_g1_i1.p1 TRINITY_DN72045_c0_g1~~TRINITY_DN72045_c0_g1_i1.p1  ORF type:complete len:561 (+),score=55.79 TRINITY_DN72045_c0_g1_i1:178-1860(+)